MSGTARTPDGDQPFRMFVKHVQAWTRSPEFAHVPPEHREVAASGVPWRTEGLAYRSDLGNRLPAGLRMPRVLGVFDLDELSHGIWLEAVSHPPVPWDDARYERAAYLLGRLAASASVRDRADVGEFGLTIQHYVDGRLAVQVLPAVMGDDVWRHPLVEAAFPDELRERLRVAAARVPENAAELAGFPVLNAHGDASPNNLLADGTPGGFVLIDYGFWTPAPAGFDLGQLVVGDVQIGRRSPALLPDTDASCVSAYTRGLADEGVNLTEHEVRRAHALQLLIFTGLSALPFELLDAPPDDEHLASARDRAAIARFCLDLVEATDP